MKIKILFLFVLLFVLPVQAAKIYDFKDAFTGAHYPQSYWRCVQHTINLRKGREEIVFVWDGFVNREQASEGKAPLSSISIAIPPDKLKTYLRLHIVGKIPMHELATIAADDLGFFKDSVNVEDPEITRIKQPVGDSPILGPNPVPPTPKP